MASRGLAALAAIATALLPAAVGAVASNGIGAFPTGAEGSIRPWLQYRLSPGQSGGGSITVENDTNAPIDAMVYSVDAAPNGDGGFGMKPLGSARRDLGGWIQVENAQIHLAPQTSRLDRFSIKIPGRASVGPHYGGIIVQPLQLHQQRSNGVTARVVTRLGVRVYETIPGAQYPSLRIESFRKLIRSGRLSFRVTVSNQGNTILTPRGGLAMRQALNSKVVSQKVNLGAALQPSDRDSFIIPSTIKPGWLPSFYSARLLFRYGSANQFSVSISKRVPTGNTIAWIVTSIGLFATLIVAVLALLNLREQIRSR